MHEPSEWLPPEAFELPHLLTLMEGLPEAYLFISLAQRRLFLTLAYNDAGVVAQYAYKLELRGDAESPTGDEPYLFCPQLALTDFINFWFQDGNGQELLEAYLIGFDPSTPSSASQWTVEQMTGLNVEEFVQQAIAYPQECIELPSYHELLEHW